MGAIAARWRLFIVISVGLLLTSIEVVDHLMLNSRELLQPQFWHRVPIYSLFIPLIVWILLGHLQRGEKLHERTAKQIDHLNALRSALLEAEDWEKLVGVIVEFPDAIMPVRRTALYAFAEEKARFELAASWSSENFSSPCESVLSWRDCSGCLSTQGTAECTIQLCSAFRDGKQLPQSIRHCLPIVYGGKQLALLHIYIGADQRMSDLEAETFSRALPEMALALSKAKLERSLANLTHAASEITKAERRRIAQDLHDGLAQNLSYMRLKLEQLSNDGSALATGKIQHDIKHLFKAASEAYEQVRSTLNELEPSCGDNLETTLRERAGFMAERAGLDISVILHGAPQPLSPECLRQVLYIFQESLINIEKHAQAHTANVEGHWTPRELILIIADDGVGFHPDADKKDQHWGITIMRQRAQSVGGNLTVESEVGAGTQVKFRVPVAGSGNYLPQGR